MKNSVTSENTKKMFAEALKRLLKTKNLSKITVREIVQECGVNHKTFYYHFHDIYDLIHWMLTIETENAVRNVDLIHNSEEAIRYLLDYVRRNSYTLNFLYDSEGKQQFYAFFYNSFISFIHTLIETRVQEHHCRMDTGYVDFLSDFYAKAMVEILMDFLEDKKKISEERMIEYMVQTFRVALAALLKNAAENEQPKI